MKKSLAFCLAVLLMVSVSGCLIQEPEGNTYRVYNSYNAHSMDDTQKYAVIDSFRTDDGKYYYVFNIGYIEAAPINIDESTGVYYSGGNQELTLSMKRGTEQSIDRTVTAMTSNALSVTNGVELSTEIPVGYAKLGLAVSSEVTKTITESFEESVTNSRKEVEEFTQTVSRSFRKNEDPVGYYCYTALASIQLYAMIVYNSENEEIEMVVPYSRIGKAFPGFIYSETSFFNCTTTNKIEFDLEKVDGFPCPSNLLDDKVTVNFDLAGGSGSVESREYRVGDTYGELPSYERHGYDFHGWKAYGMTMTPDSVVLGPETLVADWQLKTKATCSIESMQSQNGFNIFHEDLPTTANLELHKHFDITQLKNAGYSARFSIQYKVDELTTGIGVIKYEFWIENGRTTVYSFNDEFSSETTRTLQTDQIRDFEGTMFLKLLTQNIQGVRLKDIQVTVEFVK